MFELCDPTENTSNQNFKTVFPLTEAYGTRIQQAPNANPKKCYSAPPPTAHIDTISGSKVSMRSKTLRPHSPVKGKWSKTMGVARHFKRPYSESCLDQMPSNLTCKRAVSFAHRCRFDVTKSFPTKTISWRQNTPNSRSCKLHCRRSLVGTGMGADAGGTGGRVPRFKILKGTSPQKSRFLQIFFKELTKTFRF